MPDNVIVEPCKNIPFPTGLPDTVRMLNELLGILTLKIEVAGKIPAILLRLKLNEDPDTLGF